MMRFEKMTKKDFFVFCIAAFFGGIMVGLGGIGLLVSMHVFEGGLGKLVGALIFSLAMFVVTTFGLYLVTGLSTRLLTMGLKNYWSLPVSLFFNVLGIAFTALLADFAHTHGSVVEQSKILMANKMCAEGWAIHSLCSGVLCGIFIGLSVFLSKYTAKKHLSATFGVIFPVFVFVFCGFDNSLANVLYAMFAGEFTWQILAYLFLSLIGNLLGGMLVSVIPLFKKKDEPKKYKCPCCGHFTFEKKDRAYDICPVCFWEDDPEQYANPLLERGANHVSLTQARVNFLHFGACDMDMKKYVRGPKKDELHGYDR
jgi:formate/nitrite transporter FocA (FNT family)